MGKRPHFLYGEDTFAANARRPFAVGTDFVVPRDMEVQAIWFGARNLNLPALDTILDFAVNIQVSRRKLLARDQELPLRLLQTSRTPRTDPHSELGWLLKLRHPYELGESSGLVVGVQNAIAVVGAVNADAFAVAAHGRTRGLDPESERVLWLQDVLPRASTAPVSMAAPTDTNRNDGEVPILLREFTFVRGTTYTPGGGVDPCISRPQQFYLRIKPIGREEWMDRAVPLPVFGLHGCPSPPIGMPAAIGDFSGVFWTPDEDGEPLVVKQGDGFNFPVWNQNGAVGSTLGIAVIGYLDE